MPVTKSNNLSNYLKSANNVSEENRSQSLDGGSTNPAAPKDLTISGEDGQHNMHLDVKNVTLQYNDLPQVFLPEEDKGRAANSKDRGLIRIQRKGSNLHREMTNSDHVLKNKFDYFHHHYPSMGKYPKLLNTYLRSNAKFVGEQKSGKARFHIKVEFKTVDLASSNVTGFLQISGLTEDHPEITTCFKGEIINNPYHRLDWPSIHKKPIEYPSIKKYSFLTENRDWGSFEQNDLDHWRNLTSSYNLSDAQLRQKFSNIQNGYEDSQFIYMRWKEEFLLPDSRIKQISGASFEGFYYIVLNVGSNQNINGNIYSSNIIPGSINGLYYHKSSEKFQSLSLRYIDERGISNAFDFV